MTRTHHRKPAHHRKPGPLGAALVAPFLALAAACSPPPSSAADDSGTTGSTPAAVTPGDPGDPGAVRPGDPRPDPLQPDPLQPGLRQPGATGRAAPGRTPPAPRAVGPASHMVAGLGDPNRLDGSFEEEPQRAGPAPATPATVGTPAAPQASEQPKSKAPIYGGEKDPNARLSVNFGDDKHDFGRARQGEILEHTFELESTGEGPVRIRQASPTCGCVVGGLEVEDAEGEYAPYKMGAPVEPGKKVRLTAKLNTTSKRNKTTVRINVYTNDPIGLTQLTLSAQIEPFIQATPAFVNLGDIKEGAVKTQVIDIRTARGEKVKLEDDPRNKIQVPPGMEVALEPVQADEQGRSDHWRATISVGEGAKEGPLGYQLRLVTDVQMPDAAEKIEKGLPSFYTVTAAVNGRVLGVLSFTPQFLSMGLVRPGQRVPRHVKVISHDPQFDLSNVTVEVQGEKGQELAWAEYFTYSVKPAQGLNNAVDITLQLEGLPDGADGSFRGVMVIHTGHERKPDLNVRFSGVCRSGVTRPISTGGR